MTSFEVCDWLRMETLVNEDHGIYTALSCKIVRFSPPLDSGCWGEASPRGVPPSPRTFHCTTSARGTSLLVFSGGTAGTTPTDDQSVYCLETGTDLTSLVAACYPLYVHVYMCSNAPIFWIRYHIAGNIHGVQISFFLFSVYQNENLTIDITHDVCNIYEWTE